MKKIILFALFVLLSVNLSAQNETSFNGLKNGDVAPALKGENPLTNDIVQLEQGKVNLVVFWATWCRFCVQELRTPEFAEIVKKYNGNKDFNFLAVSVDEKVEDIAPFIEKFEDVSYIKDYVISDPKREQFLNYAPKSIPRTYIVGKDGKIFKSFLGSLDADSMEILDEFIETALKK